ncbi:cation transporter [Streptomyces sp. NPDC049627]|uniref:cation transporter n=1 Tax=Streptomyces sp. NPDC049627 TaxID=3365595 RepID=UPI003790CD76
MAAAILGRRPGVVEVEVSTVSETATVVFDPSVTSLAELRDWVVECGYHCAGQSVPGHLCDPMAEPDPPAQADRTRPAKHGRDVAVAEAPAEARHAPEPMPSPHEAMGHGGHVGMSIAALVADMRNRFLVAVLVSVPIVIWSPIGEDVLGVDAPVPFGLRQDIWALLLSLSVIFYACTIFIDGALRALRAPAPDMMVLVADAMPRNCSTWWGSARTRPSLC